jgi:amino acid adenylation domain-containing protein/non-ribosomal peptide synthase protein (TIGR01720 family)
VSSGHAVPVNRVYPNARAMELDLLSEAGVRELEGWNRTDVEYGPVRRVHEVFEEWAERAPGRVAVAMEGEELSYGELERKANRVAWRLRDLGVGPEEKVGISVERSLEMVVAVLGVLKAGGAYVALDPAFPRERVEHMARDAGVEVVLTQERLRGEAPEGTREVVCLDGEGWEAWPEVRPAVEVGGENLVYVIYTSGTTGVPKGVAAHHRGLSNVVEYARRVFGVGEESRLLQLGSLSFDMSVLELFMALTGGGRLQLVRSGQELSGPALGELLRREGITNLQIPPSLLDLVPAGVYPELRTVALGAEACPAELVERWGKGRRLLNCYGPTELTVFACDKHEWGGYRAEQGPPPVGGPIANMRAYVVDEGCRAVPVGVAGELLMGGVQVTRGYLGKAGLTAERFVPDPFGSEPGGRLYRSGDVARWSAGGELEFLGRRDEQVKVRGFRVELGEVETVLRRHPGVRECVVTARDGGNGTRRLVAYLVGEKVGVGELRRHLGERLPEYMVPGAYVWLEAMPLSPTGKVDRRALPEPEGRPELEVEYEAPRNEVEGVLAGIWGEVLGVERVGVRDNFFELGGDSILTMQVVTRARRAGLELGVRQLFQAQTVATLAALTRTAAAPAEDRPLAASGPVPLTPIQARYLHQEPAEPSHYNMSLLLELAAELDESLLGRALRAVLERHDALRLRFRRAGTGWEQRYAEGGWEVALERLPLGGRELARVAAEVQRTLDLERGPVLRTLLLQHADGRRWLLLLAHHLVVDVVSWRVLLEELGHAFGQLERGEPVRLGARTTAYGEWARRLAESATGERMEAELERWAEAASAPASLPLDLDVGGNTMGSAREHLVELGEERTHRLLRELPRTTGARVNEVLLAALVSTLSRWTGAAEQRVEVVGHGREELFEGVDVSRTVGWFETGHPLAATPGASAGEALRAVREALRRVPGHGIGYGVLRHLGRPEVRERLGRQGWSDVRFNYVGRFEEAAGAGERWRLADLSPDSVVSPLLERTHLLDVMAMVREGRLRTTWTYSENRHRRETIERLAAAFAARLDDLIGR